MSYGVATISRLLKIIRHFCKRALYNTLYSVKETYNFKDPTNRSHPIQVLREVYIDKIVQRRIEIIKEVRVLQYFL